MSLEAIAGGNPAETDLASHAVPGEMYQLSDYVTRSPAMQDFLETAQRVAASDSTVLILGATGVGKGLLARSIHNEGRRAGRPFVSVNCGALTESLLESELFGHEKGAFTGASRAHRGYFELADRSTLFLDEVTELPPHLQVKLLAALDERRVRPVGSEAWIRVDVRVIAASNRDIQAEVAAGRFRRDLYYRLNVVWLTLPRLAERTEDIPEFVTRYVEHFRTTLHSQARSVEPAALAALVNYAWPGNVRELVNVIERAVLLARGPEIGLADLPDHIRDSRGVPKRAEGISVNGDATTADAGLSELVELGDDWLDRPWCEVRRRILDGAERRYLAGLLERSGGRIAEVAARAAIDPRSVFEKMRRLGLHKEDFRSTPSRSTARRSRTRAAPPGP